MKIDFQIQQLTLVYSFVYYHDLYTLEIMKFYIYFRMLKLSENRKLYY